ncbi:MAG: VOC family protein [Cyanobacteria bacterium P01_H01_bin.21]
MPSEISYLEIGAKDATTSRVFFEQLLGWSFHPMGNGGEGWFQTPSVKAGLHGNDPEPQFFIFFSVPDLMAAVAQVKELGGETDEPGPDEPGFGQFCTCRDPQGIRFGLHQLPSRTA